MLSASPIPHICISPASPKNISQKLGHDAGCRPRFLNLQCHFSDMSPRHPSPLRPADCPPPRSLRRDQSDLLKVSSDRRAALGSRKLPDLRKELAIKNQRNKHLERRALFLSKIQSCTDSDSEVFTPKGSPVIHTLPSPGPEPPLVSFESLAKKHNNLTAGDCPGRYVAIDSLLPIGKPRVDPKLSRHNLPSLEEIIAHVGPARLPPSMAHDPILTKLTSRPFILPRNGKDALAARSVSDMRTDINIGRLHIPIRRRQSSSSLSNARLTSMRSLPSIETLAPTTSPTGSNTRFAPAGPNLHALGRANTAREMITTIKRRTSPPPSPAHSLDHCRSKRHSAPAEMHLKGRPGFEHPNLSLPGGF